MDTIKKGFILEQKDNRQIVRTVVKDIITIFKKENEGEFYLPEELEEDTLEYEFPKFSVSLEITIEPSDSIDDFLVNAELYRDENIIGLIIKYNPNKKNQILYNLVGELNEIIAHEIRHIDQKNRNLFDLDGPEEKGIEYYLQPHEIDAQIFGFRRMSKLTKRPFAEVVRNWFNTHKELHKLEPYEQEQVIRIIIDHNSKI